MVVPGTSEKTKKKLKNNKNLPGTVFNSNKIPMFKYSQKILSRL